jgi:hypothetical protein
MELGFKLQTQQKGLKLRNLEVLPQQGEIPL